MLYIHYKTHYINEFIIIMPETKKNAKNNETPFLCLRKPKFNLMRH